MGVKNMASRELIPEAGNCRFWKPEEPGDWIQGKVKGFEIPSSKFGKQVQILLYRGTDEYTGEEIMTYLPAHTNLKSYYSSIKIGDHIKVTLKEIIPPYTQGYSPSFKYKVEIISDEEEHKED